MAGASPLSSKHFRQAARNSNKSCWKTSMEDNPRSGIPWPARACLEKREVPLPWLTMFTRFLSFPDFRASLCEARQKPGSAPKGSTKLQRLVRRPGSSWKNLSQSEAQFQELESRSSEVWKPANKIQGCLCLSFSVSICSLWLSSPSYVQPTCSVF